ncbi:PA2169 family four-helix-bundle protein [Neolewinella lacunae]|uniref:PA2169 family four-helix-bundle protein n=1 Tax=Neolewinella lacunae TaxID=1517758 RepID=A0A923PKY1_9BACT|nr:PA2169 family four-helix-bundle protein [Neolewinella lacunae]MBC6995264.1 PA2169 family four-helix-bundle protein [Neolewinella lacunae]MDN3635567.1 PA2169 family four-helix-bundle protein [Neolewinella lacunae]
MSANKDVINSLNKLITTLYDGENGYREAAEDVSNTALASRFRTLSQQRHDFGHELKPFINRMGGEPTKGGSTAAALHRTWIDLKAAVAGNDEAAVLNECVRGEESAVETYQEVLLHEALPADAREVVKRQMDKIVTSLGEVRHLASAYEHKV